MGTTLKATLPPLTLTNGLRECLQWFTRERQWINEQHLQLSRIAAPTFLEQKRAEWMVAQFRALGCEARIDRGGNVVAQLQPDPKGPYVALTAHLDTVLAPRIPEDISLDPDGTLRGPGVSDNGAGLVALLAMARAMKACPIETSGSSVLFVANVGEEGEGNLSGMRFLCRQSTLAGKIRAFLVLDGPTTDHITCQALASRRFEVTFSGSGGHSWSDFGIGNPVHAISRAITNFVSDCAEVGRSASPRTSFNFGMIDGGSSINSIPNMARTKVDVRSESSAKIDELADLLKTSVERALQTENDQAVGGRVSAKIREIGSRPGGGLPDGSSILNILRAVDTHLGIRSHLDCASTDANIPLSMGLPAVSIGAGGRGGGAHTTAEWFHPEGREAGLKRILLALSLLLNE
jgi:acetylornithine deacetylase/succinyl-diaminopimelate desuccinylase-like protein